MKVLIITPACNEEDYLNELISSIVSQTYLPSEWIIIDDGSIDNTSDIIKKASINFPWIKYLRKEKSGKRSPGKSVMDVFYYGFYKKTLNDYDIVMKLDADLSFPNNYLKNIVSAFQFDKRLGVCGGVCVLNKGDKHILENETNLDHVRGALKSYRRECFEQIGGLVKSMGWDTVDEHHARFKMWNVSVLPELKVVHHRSTYKEYGLVKAAFRNGKMLYSIRMDVILLFLNCIKKIFKSPYFLLSIAMLWGYIYAYFKGYNFIVSKDLGQFIRSYRYQSIFKKYFS